uniref:Putative ovule protein n=1 Tax=Solanum chacoense TaxID=4108 RepID=A0A0V0HIW4_SOLCH
MVEVVYVSLSCAHFLFLSFCLSMSYWLLSYFFFISLLTIPSYTMFCHLKFRSYHDDPILNPLTPWERPPLKNIFCIYGVDSKTEVFFSSQVSSFCSTSFEIHYVIVHMYINMDD